MSTMTRTTETMNKMTEVLNSNPICVVLTEKLIDKAKRNGATDEQIAEMKQRLFAELFITLCNMDKTIKNNFASDIYDELNA